MDSLLFSFSLIFENLDLILIALFIAFGVWGAIRGMFKQLAGSIATIVAIICAAIFCKAVFNLLIKIPLFNENFYNFIYGISNKTFSSFREISASDIPSAVDGLPFVATIKETILEYSKGDASVKIDLNIHIARAVTNYIVLAFSFLLIFILIKIIFMFLRKLGERLREFEGIKKADSILGAIFGLFGLFRKLSFILFIIKIIPFTFIDGLKGYIAQSYLATFITNYNLIEWILSLIQL